MTRRVLFFHCGDDWLRGSEIVLLNLLERLDRSRWEARLVCNQEVLARAARERAGVPADVLPIPEIMWEGTSVRLPITGWLRTVRRLVRLLRGERIALLYCNSALPAQSGYPASRLAGIPMISHIHAPYVRRYAWLYRFHRAAATIFVSDASRRLLAGRVRFAAEPRVIYNGVDVERFAPAAERDPRLREALGIAAGDVVFGQVGSLIHRKGVDLAIRALAALDHRAGGVKLLFVGDGPEAGRFRDLARELNVAERVVFAGPQPDPVPFYRDVFDVNLLASRAEALPLALLEGAACGLPTLGSAAGGTPEAVLDGETGIVFPVEDQVALARGIERLAGERELRGRLGRQARSVAVERFSVAVQVREIERVMAEVLARAGRPS